MPNTIPASDPQRKTLAALVAILGESFVLTGEKLAGRTVQDWSGSPATCPAALVLPRSTQEVAHVLRICSEYGQTVVVQGGLTGLAGGANPRPGEIALSLARLNAIEEIDEVGGIAVVQAGVTLEALQTAVGEHAWSFPLDLGARGSCQLGGNAATNAGGNRVLRYGMMRNLVRGLEVVLPDGTILTMLDRVIKNNAGFDLKQLFIGTEGTLGIVTRLSLALVPRPQAQSTVLCALPDFDSAVKLLGHARRLLPELSAFELMWDGYFEASTRALSKPSPFAARSPLYALIETEGAESSGGAAALESLLEEALEKEIVTDAVVAQSVAQSKELWDIREGVSELLSFVKPCAAFDVSVGMASMGGFVETLQTDLAREFPAQQHLFFGHLGDGNLHLVSGPFGDAGGLEAVEELVYGVVGRYAGSISAEHGVGVVKIPFLHHSRSPEEVALMRRVKEAIDPGGLLNPGRIF